MLLLYLNYVYTKYLPDNYVQDYNIQSCIEKLLLMTCNGTLSFQPVTHPTITRARFCLIRRSPRSGITNAVAVAILSIHVLLYYVCVRRQVHLHKHFLCLKYASFFYNIFLSYLLSRTQLFLQRTAQHKKMKIRNSKLFNVLSICPWKLQR